MKRSGLWDAKPGAGPALTAEMLESLPGVPILNFLQRPTRGENAYQLAGFPARIVPSAVSHPQESRGIWLKLERPNRAGWHGYAQEIYPAAKELVDEYEIHYLKLPRLACTATIPQISNRSQTVTRRLTSNGLEADDIINLTDGARHKGVRVLATVEIVSVELQEMARVDDQGETLREGFPEMTGSEFRAMFRRLHKIKPAFTLPDVWRIEFRYL